VAKALEQLFPDRQQEQLELLAHHWEHSGERERAIAYLQRAGEQAMAQFANAEALIHFGRALALAPEEDLAGRYALLLALHQVHVLQGKSDEQRDGLMPLQELAEALDDDRRRAEVALWQARYAHSLPDYPAAAAAAQRGVHLAHAAGDVHMEVLGYFIWARAFEFQGDYDTAWSRFGQALTLARAAHLREHESGILYNMGNHLLQQGDIPGGRAYYEQSLPLSLEFGYRRQEGILRWYLGVAAIAQGDYDEARIYYEQVVDLFHEIGYRWWEALAHYLPGRVYHHLGEYDRARAYYEELLRGCREVGNRRGVASALCHLGMVCHHVGDEEAAQELAQQALQMTREQMGPSLEASAALSLGHALVGLGSTKEAKDAYRQSLALLRELGLAYRAMEPVAGLARVCLAEGNLAQAQAHMEEILSYLADRTHRTLGSVWELGEPLRVYLTCYRVLLANGDPRAGDVLNTAYRFLQELAAKISDEEERRSFLENVAAHREIASEYALVQRVDE